MSRPKVNLGLIAALVGGLAYPFFIYGLRGRLPPFLFVALAIVLLGLRLFATRHHQDAKFFQKAFLIATVALTLLWLINPNVAALAYPAVMSFAVASLFALSLIHPPSLVERIARLGEPEFPDDAVPYTRKVTWVWATALYMNALVASVLALRGPLELWTLWTGMLSYLLMGCLFAGEFLLRQRLRKRRKL